MNPMNIQHARIGDGSSFRQGHDFHGPVTILPEQREKPRPYSTVPFLRDADFVHREVLDEVLTRCSEPAARVALFGLGGVGKSQLAIEYSYRVREQYPDTWVFWVHASNATRFEEGYRKIARAAQIPGWEDPKMDLFTAVSDWLSNESDSKWTMIVDNADDLEVFYKSPALPQYASMGNGTSILDYLPKSSNGSILVTSRVRDTALQIVESWGNILEIGPMNASLAIRLLESKLPDTLREADREKLASLAGALDYVPLALAQAASHIRQRMPLVTVTKYLERLNRDEKDMSILLSKSLRDGRRDDREHGIASYSIIATWQISFEHIRQTRDSAARLLSFMSLFDPQGIPQELLCCDSKDDDSLEEFEEDVLLLREYLLVTFVESNSTFKMHRLVQFATRRWLEARGELQKFEEQYISLIYASAPEPDDKIRIQWDRIFSHAKLVLKYRPVNQQKPFERIHTLDRIGHLTYERGSWLDAEPFFRQAMEAKEKQFGEDHPETLHSAHQLAKSLSHSPTDYLEAEMLYIRVKETRERRLGKDHPLAWDVAKDLANNLTLQGKYSEAEFLARQVMASQEKILRETHPRVLFLILGPASTSEDGDEHSVAEGPQEEGIDGIDEAIRKDCITLLRTMGDLASALQRQRKYSDAERLYSQVLKGRRKLWGKEHPAVAIAASYLAGTLMERGESLETEELFRQNLKRQDKIFGSEHPHKLRNFASLAEALNEQKRYLVSEWSYRQALRKWKETPGKKHPNTLLTGIDLARTLVDHGTYAEAEKLLKPALRTQEKILGGRSIGTLWVAVDLAQAVGKQGKHEEAERILRRVLEEKGNLKGSEDWGTLQALWSLAQALSAQGKHEEAETVQRQVLDKLRKTYSEGFRVTLWAAANLAITLRKLANYPEAEELERMVLKEMSELRGKKHLETLWAAERLAWSLHQAAKHGEAERLYRQTLKKRKKVQGKEHPNTRDTAICLAILLLDLGREAEIQDLFKDIVGDVATDDGGHEESNKQEAKDGDCNTSEA